MQNYLLYYNGKSNEMLRNSFIIHRVKFIMQEFFQTHSYLSQIFGFLAIAVGILMYQFKKHKTIMILMTLNAALWCLHYGSLWLFTPVAMNFINLARSYVCSFDNKFSYLIQDNSPFSLYFYCTTRKRGHSKVEFNENFSL